MLMLVGAVETRGARCRNTSALRFAPAFASLRRGRQRSGYSV